MLSRCCITPPMAAPLKMTSSSSHAALVRGRGGGMSNCPALLAACCRPVMNSVCHPLKLKSCHRWLSVKSVVIASNDKSSRAKGLKLHSQRHQVSHGPLVSWQRPSLRNTTCQDISNRKQAIPWETPAEPLYIILEEMLLVRRLEWESWSADLWKKIC